MTDTRYEIFGIKINREEHYASSGRMRMFWVLRDEHNHIELMTKTLEDMIHEMMFNTMLLSKQRRS